MSTRTIIVSVVIAIIATVAVVVGSMTMLGTLTGTNGDDPGEAAGGQSSISEGASTVDAVAERPGCPAPSVAGIELPCLGGESDTTAIEAGVAVINVWAWWCGPCRDELPYVQAFADAHPEYTVVGVHADPSAARGAAFLDDIDVALASYQDDDNTFAGTLGLPNVVPITVVAIDGEVVKFFPTPFSSVEEIEQAVGEAVDAEQ